MSEFFNPEKGIWAWLSTLVDVVGLSVLWIALCLPVATIGPATAALYYTVVKCVRKQENGAFGVYLRSFRSNLKTGLKATLIALPPAVILVAAHLVSLFTERVFRKYAPELEGKGPEDAVE